MTHLGNCSYMIVMVFDLHIFHTFSRNQQFNITQTGHNFTNTQVKSIHIWIGNVIVGSLLLVLN